MLGEKQSGTVQKTNFFNAIFTGAIAYGKKITFTYDEFGMEKVVELQNNKMPYGQAGAYQAYLTYETLDAAVKQKITALTMARMDEEESAEVRAAVDGLNAKMSQRIAGYLSFYAGDLKQKGDRKLLSGIHEGLPGLQGYERLSVRNNTDKGVPHSRDALIRNKDKSMRETEEKQQSFRNGKELLEHCVRTLNANQRGRVWEEMWHSISVLVIMLGEKMCGTCKNISNVRWTITGTMLVS